jgi:hypothetical protein
VAARSSQIMWLATLAILMQVFYNLAVMRYALYSGESIFVGFLRTHPGPRFWTPFYLLLDIGTYWPFLSPWLWLRSFCIDSPQRTTAPLFGY